MSNTAKFLHEITGSSSTGRVYSPSGFFGSNFQDMWSDFVQQRQRMLAREYEREESERNANISVSVPEL